MSHSSVIHRRARAGLVAGLVAALTLAFAAPSGAGFGPPTITSPADGGVVKGPNVTISGTSEPGLTVTVHEGGSALGTVDVGADGTWALTVALGDGTHDVFGTASDGLVSSAPGAHAVFDVDSARPAVAITSPASDHVFATEAPVIEGDASDARALFAIRLEYWALGSMVKAELATCEGCDAGAADATWSHAPTLVPGEYMVKAFAVDQASNYSLSKSVRFVSTSAGISTGDLGLPLPEEVTIPEITTPEDGGLEPGAAAPVEFGGTADPGSTVELYEDVQGLGKIGGSADTAEDGTWSIKVRMPTGEYGVHARAIDEEGNVSDLSEAVTFTVDGERPDPAILTANHKIFLPTETVRLEGTVSDNFTADYVVVEYYDLQGKRVERGNAVCDACPASQAAWYHEPSALAFGPGTYTAKVFAYDVAGNASHIDEISFIKTL